MNALKHGALSAREAVDLINVVGALTRLTGAIELIKKIARTEVAKSAQTLGLEHFLASRPGLHDWERRAPEMDAEAAEMEDDELPRQADECWLDMPEGDEGLQTVADSEITPPSPPTPDPSPPLPPAFAGVAGGGEPRGL